MKWIIILGLVVFAQSQQFPDTTSTAANFCNMNVCNEGETSIACLFTQSTKMMCSDGQILSFNKDALVKKHNELRQKIASGSMKPKFDSAAQMPELKYSEELAQMSLYNAKRCTFDHDECSSTKTFITGQNLFWSGLLGNENIDELIARAVDNWFSEYEDTTMKDINSLPEFSGKDIGHFTQLVTDKTKFVGCTAATFTEPEYGYGFYLVCDYGNSHMQNEPVYITGLPGSKCSARSSTYSALCSK